MRPLALAAIAASLAGCSLNYADTTFRATPRFKHSEGHEGGREIVERAGEPVAGQERDHTGEDGDPRGARVDEATNVPTDAIGRTPAVFPNSALPSGRAPERVTPPQVLGSVQPDLPATGE